MNDLEALVSGWASIIAAVAMLIKVLSAKPLSTVLVAGARTMRRAIRAVVGEVRQAFDSPLWPPPRYARVATWLKLGISVYMSAMVTVGTVVLMIGALVACFQRPPDLPAFWWLGALGFGLYMTVGWAVFMRWYAVRFMKARAELAQL